MIYFYWILGILLFLILVLLFVPFRLDFYYLEDLRLSLGFLMFKYKLFPGDKVTEEQEDEKEEKPEKAKKRKKKNKENEEEDNGKGKEKLPIIEKLKLIIKILKQAKLPFKRFFKKVKIRKLKVEILIGSQDSFDTGRNYAIISESVYLLLNLLDTLFDLKAESVYVYPDFKEEKNKYYIEGTVKINLMQSAILLISLLKRSGRDIMKLI